MKRTIKITPKISPKLTKKYEGKWVVLSNDYKRVIVSGKALSDVLKETANKKEGIVMKVLPNLGYAPFSC